MPTYSQRVRAENALKEFTSIAGEDALAEFGIAVKANGEANVPSLFTLVELLQRAQAAAGNDAVAKYIAAQKPVTLEDQIKAIVRSTLREELQIDVGASAGSWTMPNERQINLRLAGDEKEFSTANIDVADKPEYEG